VTVALTLLLSRRGCTVVGWEDEPGTLPLAGPLERSQPVRRSQHCEQSASALGWFWLMVGVVVGVVVLGDHHPAAPFSARVSLYTWAFEEGGPVLRPGPPSSTPSKTWGPAQV
jgi:hypothetical protein